MSRSNFLSLLIVLLIVSCKSEHVEYVYFPDSKIVKAKLFNKNNGKEFYVEEYFRKGNIKKEFCILDERIDGVYLEYFENGNLKEESFKTNGKLNGLAKTYYDTGQLYHELSHKQGVPIGKGFYYYKNGQIKAENRFYKGKTFYSKFYSKEDSTFQENIIPIISFDKDTLLFGNTLEITFEIPVVLNSEINRDSCIIEFGLGKDSLDLKKYNYPPYKIRLENGTITKEIIIEELGRHTIYGHTYYMNKESQKIVFESFRKLYFVKEKDY